MMLRGSCSHACGRPSSSRAGLEPNGLLARTCRQVVGRQHSQRSYFAYVRSTCLSRRVAGNRHTTARTRLTTTAVVSACKPTLPVSHELNGKEYCIRHPSSDEEYARVAHLRAEAFYEGSSSRFVKTFKQQFIQNELQSLKQRTKPGNRGYPETECLVAAGSSNSVIGCVDLQLPGVMSGIGARNQAGGDANGAYIYNLVVDEGYRRQGVGRLLMQVAMARAVELWGATALYTRVDAQNEVAFQLYSQFGFKAEAEERRHAGTSALGRVVLLKNSLDDGASPTAA